jgi:hypothetical protein
MSEQPKTAAPADAPAVDVSKLSEEEKAYYDKFGMLPKKSLASAMLDKRRGAVIFSSLLDASFW